MYKTQLIQKIKTVEGLSQDECAYLINLVNNKKIYGLIWEEKPEAFEEKLRNMLPVLREVESKRIVIAELPKIETPKIKEELFETEKIAAPGNSTIPNHVLIEGDNLHALTALSFTHEGKIDVIYIDPPYNTGNKDFKYHDAFKDEAEFIDKEHPFRHSTWLSFMSKRLTIAKRLLSNDGIIFISIDENECYQLKILCDEIFGNKNFIADHIWKSKSGGAGDASFIATDTENILLYAKNKGMLIIDNDDEATVTTSYNREDENGDRYSLDRLDKQSLGYLASLDFPIIGPDGLEYIVEHKDPNNKVARWRWGQDTVEERIDELVFENGYVYTKNYEKESAKPRNLLIEERFGRTRTGKTELFSIVGANDFTAPKPSRLISYLIKLFPKKDATILDFFAGSGTTLQAVMQLNSVDGGNRKCIICTNNENNICESVTYPRVYNVINGYKSKGNSQVELFSEKLTIAKIKKADKLIQKVNQVKVDNLSKYNKIKIEVKDNSINVWGESKQGQEVNGFKNNNLRYYKTEFVGREPSIKNKKEITRLAAELLCIKEDIYSEQKKIGGYLLNATYVRCFQQDQLYLLVIYDEDVIEQMVEVIKSVIAVDADRNVHFKVYVFSNGQYPYTEEFEEVLPYITLCALPDAIYKAYQNVLPKRHRQQVPELEETKAEDVETSIQDGLKLNQ